MEIYYNQAAKDDIDELIRLRIAYISEDTGRIPEPDIKEFKERLRDYFGRKLENELIVFTARESKRIVAVAFLQIIEMPVNSNVVNGFYGIVLNVYTEPEYRGKGIGTELMKDLLKYGKDRKLSRIDLSSTEAGYPMYSRLGFRDRGTEYREMRYTYVWKTDYEKYTD